MKKILFLVCLVGMAVNGYAWKVESYEVAQSSWVSGTVVVSSDNVTFVGPAPAQISHRSIDWYSVSLYNVESSSAVYTITSSSYTAPSLSCDNGIPIGSGTPLEPFSITEKFLGMYMWALSCDDKSVTLRKVQRGR